ncbi:conserved hypothetical protein [Methanolacinia petrolearia DSM 11571]|uniref:Uncharacterized protein n=1 Tax=Methanolacinia petrolearia (strain DSM 11571 / OCM 486 / SEBR 4847) TaxID=679926 RepID=E1RHK1_METP4|nr:hypothetical protein [Methanolacinia petrolearia]ADN35310.1 conserved hypothetical protein [Methanolacinia petrolearia DSM 11571]
MIKEYGSEGVSEAIGFLIMFTIVLTGIAMVSLVGYPMLIQTQISSDERNMEQAMISVQNDMKIMTFSNVPFRDSTIKVSGGGLTAIDNTSFGQSFTISDDTGTGFSVEYKPGAIQYESDDGTAVLTLMNGAVVRREKFQSGSVMIAEPRWFYDSDEKTLVIYMTVLNADREYYERGIGTIKMSMKTQPVIIDTPYGTPATVTVTYAYDPDDDYSVAWRNYLTGDSIVEGGFAETGSGKYSLSGVERLVVKEYDIKIENM